MTLSFRKWNFLSIRNSFVLTLTSNIQKNDNSAKIGECDREQTAEDVVGNLRWYEVSMHSNTHSHTYHMHTFITTHTHLHAHVHTSMIGKKPSMFDNLVVVSLL